MAIDLGILNAEADQMIASAIKVLNTPVNTPGYSGANLGPVRKEVARASATRDEASKTIDASKALAATANAQVKEGFDAKALAEGDKARADQQQSQLVADQYRLYAEMFGISLDSSSEIAQIAKVLTVESPKAVKQLKELQEMQSVSLLDDPLEYIYNVFQVPAAAQAYNRQADIVNTLQNTLDNKLKTAGDAGALGAKGVPTIIVGQAKAVADLALANAVIAKANADDAFARTNVDFATKKLAGDLSIASATINTTQLQMQDAQNRFQAQVAAIQAADTRANRLMKAGELLTRLADNQGLDVLLANYDRILGKPPGSTSRQVFKSLSDEQQKNIAAIATGSAGANPYEAFQNFVKVIPGNAMSPETTATVGWMQQKLVAINTAMETAQVAKELRPAKFAESIKTAIEQEQAQAYKPGTLFHEVEPAKLIAAGLIAKDSKLAMVLEPLTKTNASMTPEIITKAIMAQFSNPVEAGHMIAQYYDANLTFMNTAGNFKLLKIPEMKQYRVPAEKGILGISFGDKMPMYDLTKSAEAVKYVLRTQVKEATEKLRSGKLPLSMSTNPQNTMEQYRRVTE